MTTDRQSLGFSSSRFARAAVRRLRAALATGDPGTVLEAGALASAVVEREANADAAARRAAAMLEALLLDAAESLPTRVRGRLEHAVEDCLCIGGGPIPARLDDLWRDLAAVFDTAAVAPEADALDATIQDYLAASLDDRASLGELARRLGYSAAHVSTLVRRLTGKSFRVVRQEMRLARARWHLEHGASVKTAAFESGFKDPAYMSRVFARCHGMPPSRWRGTRREGV